MKSMNIEEIRIQYQKVQNSDIEKDEKIEKISGLYTQLCKVWKEQGEVGDYGKNPLAIRNAQEQLPDDFLEFFLETLSENTTVYKKFLKRNKEEGENKKYLAEEIVEKYISTFKKIDREIGEKAEKILYGGQVDMEVSNHKFPGAFTSYQYDTPAFTLLQYKENIASAFTIAHEMGHALHGTLSQIQKAPVYHTPFCVAETAAILSEILFFDENFYKNPEAREYFFNSLFTAIFYQFQITLFEKKAHENTKYEKYDFSEIWNITSKEVSGNMGDKDYWLQIGHIFYSPFYCYAYSFGVIAAMSIFLKYKSGEITSSQIKEFYSLGNSLSPLEILKKYDIDMRDKEVYKRVFLYLENAIKESDISG